MDPPTVHAARDTLRKPHYQLAAVVVLGALLAGALIGFGIGDRDARTRDLRDLDGRLLPATVQLQRADLHLARTQLALVSLRPDQPLDEQQATLAAVRTESAATADAWKAFRRLAVPVPRTTAPRVAFERAQGVYNTNQTQSIAARLGVGSDSPTIAESNQASATMARTLDELSRRYQDEARTRVQELHDTTRRTQGVVVLGAVIAGIVLAVAGIVTFVSMRRRDESARRRDEQHARESERSQLETSLQRAFEMVRSEEGTYSIVSDALRESVPQMHVELLAADSSRAHFRHVLSNGNDAYPGCDVPGPQECPATSRTQTFEFPSSTQLAACPYLRDRGVVCGAVCVPVSIAGKSIAVLHAVGAAGEPDRDAIETLSLVARRAGERLGSLRAFARTEEQARTDPLTGLLNRRSLEHDVQALVEDQRPFVVAYGDVDHFKRLNDLHGHDTGDRALRLFSRVLRDCVRPTDLPARYGGEEFVIVLPEADVSVAVAVVERFREALALELAAGQLPGFTVSFGVAAAAPGHAFGETVDAADAALLQAKAQGRNRVVTGRIEVAPSLHPLEPPVGQRVGGLTQPEPDDVEPA
jgi:diguanylate cyclase (GGDEF)-like protein